MRHAAGRGDYGPGDPEGHIERLYPAFERREPHRLERHLPDGTALEIRGQPVPDGGFVITYTNITERKRIEDALQESEQRYRGLVEMSLELIMVMRNHRIVFINAAGADMLGAGTPEDVIGMHILEIIHPEYRPMAKQRIRAMLATGQAVPTVHQAYRRLDGGTVDLEVTSTPFAHPEGTSIMVVARDVSDRLKAETALQGERSALPCGRRQLAHQDSHQGPRRTLFAAQPQVRNAIRRYRTRKPGVKPPRTFFPNIWRTTSSPTTRP